MNVSLGRTSRGDLSLSDEERSRHVHLVGASGTGKSKLMESMIRQDILAGRGLCLIDPHGTLVDEIVRWAASLRLDENRRIHVIEAADPAWSAGFNPLRLDGFTEPAVRVDAMVAACAQVWGGEDLTSTPRLKKTLRAVFYALAVRNLTLVEAPSLTSGVEHELRKRLTANLPDYVFGGLWDDFNGLSRREFVEVFESTNNRLGEFLTSPGVRRIVGQSKCPLDLKQIMDDGEVLLVNLVPRAGLSFDNVRLLGTLLTSELFLLALGRDAATAQQRPFTLYIDECYDYLTADIERMLDQTRKFGLHLVLAHQRLGQLRARSDSIYNGVMAGGQTKIVFGGMTDEDADIMAREIYRSSLDLERPKHVLDKPIVYDEVPFWLESESDDVGGSRNWGSTEFSAWATNESAADSTGERVGQDGSAREATRTTSYATGEAASGGTADSVGGSETWAHRKGRAQTLKPLRKDMPTAVYSLEEALHQAIVKLRELPNQAAVVKRRGREPVRFRPEEIKPALATDNQVSGFIARARAASPFISSAVAAEEEIADRRLSSANFARLPSKAEEADFWNP